MFKFDDRYIVLVILLPGIFLLGNLYIALSIFSILPPFTTVGALGVVYALALALFFGSICWWVQHKKWIIDTFDTSTLFKEIQNKQVNGKNIITQEVEKNYQVDFGKPLLPKKGNLKRKKAYLRGVVSNLHFTMDRAVGLEKPSAYRLLLDTLSALLVATCLSGVFLLTFAIMYYTMHMGADLVWNVEAIYFGGLIILAFILLKYLIIPTLREYYHLTLFLVYSDKQYKTKIHEYIHGSTIPKTTD